MLTFAKLYQPITATPFLNNETYCEIAPCDALKPYIRCFWGTKYPLVKKQEEPPSGLIIPDTCMDIIFNINYTKNSYNGWFCTLDEHSYRTPGSVSDAELTASFAIRFYAWSAILFSEADFRHSKNQSFQVEQFFQKLKKELASILFEVPTLQGKVKIAETFLLKRLCNNRINNDFLNSISYILGHNGRAKISDVCDYTVLSEKQLERIFNYNMGVSPKTFSSLIRYQLLWQEMVLSPNFNMLDAVEKYGYTDQSHLLRDFKKRHLLNPTEAVSLARNSR